MEFTCKPIKNETNIREWGLPLLAARAMFNSGMVARDDSRKVYTERRFIGYNRIEGRLMLVVFCASANDLIHIISFRKANRCEQAKFEIQAL